MLKSCLIEGCDALAIAKGLCGTHYKRDYRGRNPKPKAPPTDEETRAVKRLASKLHLSERDAHTLFAQLPERLRRRLVFTLGNPAASRLSDYDDEPPAHTAGSCEWCGADEARALQDGALPRARAIWLCSACQALYEELDQRRQAFT